jgi:NADH-quinone oxidoreductase subunit L
VLELTGLIPAIPFFSFSLLALFGPRLSRRAVSVIGVGSIAASAFISGIVTAAFISGPPAGWSYQQVIWQWMSVSGFRADIGFYLDALSAVMVLVITFVAFLIHLYSTEYMEGDEGYSRFFAYMNLFVASMVTLVLADNLLLLYLGWEGVGLCSYLLIGFWYTDPVNGRAARKAFIVTRVGDTSMLIGLFLIFHHLGTLNIQELMHRASLQWPVGAGVAIAAAALLLGGAVGKSAQLPLQTWLPDAMAGPTPTSALIHAATMVTAGVYLIARTHVLFSLAPPVMLAVAVIGAATLLLAGCSALTQRDIKRVLAYSTISQIGYMFLALGVGAWSAAIFHFMTHAFFKALLFMAAGSIIGAMAGEQSLDRMKGFRRAMPFTFASFAIGGLALSGIPPFSGFFSKDEILLVTAERGGWHWALYVVGYVGALLTSIYTFRMIFRAFFGEPVAEARELEEGRPRHAEQPTNPATGEVEDTDVGFPGPSHAIAERALEMRAAMSVLAIGAVGAGLLQIPQVDFVIDDFLRPSFGDSSLYATHTRNGLLILGLVLGTAIGLTGIAIAWRVWVARPGTASAVRARLAPLYELFVNKWYFDELIDALIVRPAQATGRFAAATFERVFVEGTLVGGTTSLVRAGSASVRAVQSGLLRYYAALLLVGVSALGLYFLLQS